MECIRVNREASNTSLLVGIAPTFRQDPCRDVLEQLVEVSGLDCHEGQFEARFVLGIASEMVDQLGRKESSDIWRAATMHEIVRREVPFRVALEMLCRVGLGNPGHEARQRQECRAVAVELHALARHYDTRAGPGDAIGSRHKEAFEGYLTNGVNRLTRNFQ